MSEVEVTTVTSGEGTPLPAGTLASAVNGPVAGAPAPAQKLNAIQIIEQEIGGFLRQREQAVANVHAVEGAIQAGQHLLAKLKAAAAKAEAEVNKVVTEVVDAVKEL